MRLPFKIKIEFEDINVAERKFNNLSEFDRFMGRLKKKME